jgi:hypothetical protein
MNYTDRFTCANSFRPGRMMAYLLTSSMFFVSIAGFGQDSTEKVKAAMKEFHQALVKKDTISISRLTHANLSYGHSNGLLETKTEILKNNISGYLSYNSISEDSINIIVTGNVATVRFTTDINSSVAGNPPVDFHRKVLEVWILEKKQWLLLARQAAR